MDIIKLTTDTLAELKAEGGARLVIDYLKKGGFSEEISAQKLASWLKKRDYPAGVLIAVTSQELAMAGSAEHAPEVETRTNDEIAATDKRLREQLRRSEVARPVPEPGPIDDLDETGTRAGAMVDPNAYAVRDRKTGAVVQKFQARPVGPVRQPDIRMRDRPPVNPEPEDELEAKISKVLIKTLLDLGIVHQTRANGPVQEPPEEEPMPAQDTRRRARQGSNWNHPKRRQVVVQV